MDNALDEPVPSRGRVISNVCIVAPIITAIFVALRAYSRFVVTRKNYAADWCCYVTMVWLVAFSATLAQAPKYGMGRHIDDFTPDMTEGMYFWIMFYVLSLWGYKMALLLLYLQFFGVFSRYRRVVYAVIFYVSGYLLCNLILELAQCRPIQKFYRPSMAGHCANSQAINIVLGVFHMTSDFIIAILPLPVIWRLQLRSKKEKIGLSLILGVGVIAWVVACVRFIYAVVDLTSADRTWIAGVTFFMSVLEVNTGLICGCLPAMKPLLGSIRAASPNESRKRPYAKQRSLSSLHQRSSGRDVEAAPAGSPVELHNLPPLETDYFGAEDALQERSVSATRPADRVGCHVSPTPTHTTTAKGNCLQASEDQERLFVVDG